MHINPLPVGVQYQVRYYRLSNMEDKPGSKFPGLLFLYHIKEICSL